MPRPEFIDVDEWLRRWPAAVVKGQVRELVADIQMNAALFMGETIASAFDSTDPEAAAVIRKHIESARTAWHGR